MIGAQHLPWMTPPSGLGGNNCDWCGRMIYEPALPCSIRPPAGLAEMETPPGLGARCKWELATRDPDALASAEDELR